MVKEIIAAYENSGARCCAEQYEGAQRLEQIDAQVADLKQQIAALYDERESIAKRYGNSRVPNWFDDIVHPLAKELAAKAGFPHAEVHGPCGLASRVFVTLWTCYPELTGKSLVLQPAFDDENHLFLVYETGEMVENCPPGSLGESHGMNLGTAPLPDSLEGILAVTEDTPDYVLQRYSQR